MVDTQRMSNHITHMEPDIGKLINQTKQNVQLKRRLDVLKSAC